MKISVIIAAYNIENYIERCLQSIVNQTLKEIEIIIVNDGSTDNTLNIIKNISIDYKNISLINKENEGLIEARKSGLKIATGEYILFVDGDDWLEIDALDKLYRNAMLNNSDIVMYNAFKSYEERKENFSTFNKLKGNKQDYLSEFFIGNIFPSIWAKLLRREFIEKNNVRFADNINWGEDVAIVASLLMNKPKISFVNDYLYNYYQRSDSFTNVRNNKIKEIFTVFNFIKEELNNKNLYKTYEKQFECLIFNHSHLGSICDISLFEKEYKYIHKEFYNIFKERNINIKENRYILNRINKMSLSHRLRTKFYFAGYYLGKQYDFIKNIGKKILIIK